MKRVFLLPLMLALHLQAMEDQEAKALLAKATELRQHVEVEEDCTHAYSIFRNIIDNNANSELKSQAYLGLAKMSMTLGSPEQALLTIEESLQNGQQSDLRTLAWASSNPAFQAEERQRFAEYILELKFEDLSESDKPLFADCRTQAALALGHAQVKQAGNDPEVMLPEPSQAGSSPSAPPLEDGHEPHDRAELDPRKGGVDLAHQLEAWLDGMVGSPSASFSSSPAKPRSKPELRFSIPSAMSLQDATVKGMFMDANKACAGKRLEEGEPWWSMCLFYCPEDDAFRLNAATVQLELGLLDKAEMNLEPPVSGGFTVQHAYLLARLQFLNGGTGECLQTLLQLSSTTGALPADNLKHQLLQFHQSIRYLAQECLRLEAQRHDHGSASSSAAAKAGALLPTLTTGANGSERVPPPMTQASAGMSLFERQFLASTARAAAYAVVENHPAQKEELLRAVVFASKAYGKLSIKVAEILEALAQVSARHHLGDRGEPAKYLASAKGIRLHAAASVGEDARGQDLATAQELRSRAAASAASPRPASPTYALSSPSAPSPELTTGGQPAPHAMPGPSPDLASKPSSFALADPTEPSQAASSGDAQDGFRSNPHENLVLGYFIGWAPYNHTMGFVKSMNFETGMLEKYAFNELRLQCPKDELKINTRVAFEKFTNREGKTFAQYVRVLPEDMSLKYDAEARAFADRATQARARTDAEAPRLAQEPQAPADGKVGSPWDSSNTASGELFQGEFLGLDALGWGELRYTPKEHDPTGANVYNPHSPEAIMVPVHRNALRGDKSLFQRGAKVEFVYRVNVGKYAQRVRLLEAAGAQAPQHEGDGPVSGYAPAAEASTSSFSANPKGPSVPAGRQIGVFFGWSKNSDKHGTLVHYRDPAGLSSASAPGTFTKGETELIAFHKKRLGAKESDLKPGTVVTFEFFVNRKHLNNVYAQHVQLASPEQASSGAIQRLSLAAAQSAQVHHAVFSRWLDKGWGKMHPLQMPADATVPLPLGSLPFDPSLAIDFHESTILGARDAFQPGVELEYRFFPLMGPHPQQVKVVPPELSVLPKNAVNPPTK